MQNFFARLVCCENKRNERYAGRKGCHQDGNHPLQRAAFDHLARESLALVAHEVQVVREHHNAVAGGDASHGDKSDQRGDADVVHHEPREHQAAKEGKRDVEQNLECQ